MVKGKVPMLVAGLFALGAALAAWIAIQKKGSDVEKHWTLTTVVVASEALPEGTVLTREQLAERKVPEQFVTRSVVRPETVALVVGQKLLAPLQAGDLLLWTHVQSSSGTQRLSETVRKTGRAFSLDVSNSQVSVGGWVRPNDRVDVLATYTAPSTEELEVTTLLQNVIVLATGRATGQNPSSNGPEELAHRFDTVTLLVSPEEAELLTVALGSGSLALTLRNPDDFELEEERGRASLATILTGDRGRPPEKRRHRPRSVTVIRGTEIEGH